MAKINELNPIFCECIPQDLEDGKLYISEKYSTATHLCACGCGRKTVTGLQPKWKDGWLLSNNGNLITLWPSIGNFSGESPYHAHYYITKNKIEWL